MKARAALAFLFASFLVSQSPAPAGQVVVVGAQTPVRLEVTQPAVAGKPFNFVIANASPKPIAAVIVATVFYDAKGNRQQGPAQITALSLLPDEQGLAPSAAKDVRVTESYTVGRGADRAAPSRAELSVDYVLYMDNTNWGPNQAHMASDLRSMRSGAAMERARLAEILKTKGPAALLAHLAER